MMLKQPESNQTLRVRITDLNAESLYLCGFPAFILSNGSGLALFVERVIARLRRIYEKDNHIKR